jgi:hypothetical protein
VLVDLTLSARPVVRFVLALVPSAADCGWAYADDAMGAMRLPLGRCRSRWM